MMRWHVDPWNPAYGTGLEPAEESPAARSSAQLDADVEVPADEWRPLVAPADIRSPRIVLLVDGVRRNDAWMWSTEPDGDSHPGLAASYAAGVVRCDLRSGAAAVAGTRVLRGLFTSSPTATDIQCGSIRYALRRSTATDPAKLTHAVQPALTALEVELAQEARASTPDGDDDLLVVDGPLRGRAHLPRALGYVKTHRVEYLSRPLSTVVASLAAGQRCPVFLLGTSWHRYTWYLRLPGPPGSPWSGIVRVECSAELSRGAAIALADLSATTLPRFASTPYKDPRAPQNLVPVAGLERRLRGLLGDPRLLHRTLVGATTRAASATVDA
ncbi:MAG TPA: hypothetical protein VFC00_25640 [Micromonosporaceae bacterium]|nr:hypothetical protein [Micromonosporaceae bacterium]